MDGTSTVINQAKHPSYINQQNFYSEISNSRYCYNQIINHE